MRELLTVLMLLLSAIFLFGCTQKDDEKDNGTSTGLPNPASQYCENQGDTLTIITDQNGNQYGICKFDDSTECEEWDYFNGKCKPGDTKIAVPINEDQCKTLGGDWDFVCNLPTKDAGKYCTDGSQCQAGLCLTETQTSTAGKCPEWKFNYGCFSILEDGKNGAICID